MDKPVAPARTVCHGCRGVTTVTEQTSPDQYVSRMMIVPGDGTVTRMVIGIGDLTEVAATETCPVCNGEDWLPEFLPPV
ncbi:MAG TPA: hypothetical protein VHW44_19205 [Pseudonocardiaceae bacterium]|nr:hypothetical protein [Pseudonocardiaceae bacterium]